MLDLQNVLRTSLDRVSDGVSVSGTLGQGLEDQHVQRPLRRLALQRGFTPRHVPEYRPLDDRPVKENDTLFSTFFIESQDTSVT